MCLSSARSDALEACCGSALHAHNNATTLSCWRGLESPLPRDRQSRIALPPQTRRSRGARALRALALSAITEERHQLGQALFDEELLHFGRDREVALHLGLVVRDRLAVVGLFELPRAFVLRERRRRLELPRDFERLDRVAHRVLGLHV